MTHGESTASVAYTQIRRILRAYTQTSLYSKREHHDPLTSNPPHPMIATGIPISTGIAYLHALGFTQAMLRYMRESGSITGYTSQDIERYLILIQSMTAVRSSTIENIRARAQSTDIESITEYALSTKTRYVIRGDHDYPLGLAISPMSPEILYVR